MIKPLEMRNVGAFLERQEERITPYQWARELLVNAREAGATELRFDRVFVGGVAKRAAIDNGVGMSPRELKRYLGNLGEGGKPIGGIHANFGMGAKLSLIGWSDFAVISRVEGGGTNMVMLLREGDSYGLRRIELEGRLVDECWDAEYDDPEWGVNWGKLLPSDWTHGTAVVLLGRRKNQNTTTGNPSKGEGPHGLRNYLSQRFWEFPANLHVSVQAARYDAVEPAAQSWHRTRVNGAHAALLGTGNNSKQEETVELQDGAQIHVLYSREPMPARLPLIPSVMVQVLYQGELYALGRHRGATADYLRAFGIAAPELRQKVFLLLEPPVYSKGHPGVMPEADDRAALAWSDGKGKERLPFQLWAQEFVQVMPDWLKKIVAASQHVTLDEYERKAEREMLKMFRFLNGREMRSRQLHILQGEGDLTGSPIPPSPRLHLAGEEKEGAEEKTAASSSEPKAAKAPRLPKGETGRDQPALEKRGVGTLPVIKWVDETGPLDERFIPWPMAATYQRNDANFAGGIIYIDRQHPQLKVIWRYWEQRVEEGAAWEVVRDAIETDYGARLKAYVLHAQEWASISTDEQLDLLLSDASIQAHLLGVPGLLDQALEQRLRSMGVRLHSVAV